MSSEPPVIILDNGTGYLKAGFSNEKTPSVMIPTIVGRQMLRADAKLEKGASFEGRTIIMGNEVNKLRSLLDLSHPISDGVIMNKDDLKLLWEYTLEKELGITDLSDKKILLTEAPDTPISNKKTICEIMFNELGVQALNIEIQAKLSLYCEGIDSGIVVDSGDGVSHCVPISNGHILKHSIKEIRLAGRTLTNYFIKLLQRKGYHFNSTSDFELIREMKEKFCFVSNDIVGDRELGLNTTFFNTFVRLPDGNDLFLSDEKFETPELLFNPMKDQIELPSIPEMVFDSINSSPIDVRASLYNAMVLSGATTLFPGFATRFENEIKALYKKNILKKAQKKDVKISINAIDSPRRKFSVFFGASVIGNYNNNPQGDDYWITRDEWNECEDCESLIKKKCKSYLADF